MRFGPKIPNGQLKNTGKSSSDDEVDPTNPGGVNDGDGAWFFEYFDKTTKTTITLRGYYMDINDGRGISTVYGIMVNDIIEMEAWPGDYEHARYGLEGANEDTKMEAARELGYILKHNKKGGYETPPEETKFRAATYAEILADYNS